MKNILCTIFFLGLTVMGFAQQESQYTFFTQNKLYYNPAYAGSRNAAGFTGLYRNQWIGFEGAPVSQTLNFDAPIGKVGIGGNVTHFTKGIQESWNVAMAYSYNVQVSNETSLRLGVQGSVNYLGLDFSDPSVVVDRENDPSLMNAQSNRYSGNFGLGAYLTHKDIFYFGISSPSFYPTQIGFNDAVANPAQRRAHLYVMTGVSIKASEKVEIQPNVLYKYVRGAPGDLEVNLNAIFLDQVLAGLNYRAGGENIGESIGVLVFYQFDDSIGAGLAYDFAMSEIREQTSGTVEVVVRYALPTKRQDLQNPRFF